MKKGTKSILKHSVTMSHWITMMFLPRELLPSLLRMLSRAVTLSSCHHPHVLTSSLGSLVRDNLELYKWACGMVAFDQELQSCFLFHRLSKTPSGSIRFRDVSLSSLLFSCSCLSSFSLRLFYSSSSPYQWTVSGKHGNDLNLVEFHHQLERARKESSDRGDFGNICSGESSPFSWSLSLELSPCLSLVGILSRKRVGSHGRVETNCCDGYK
jgi:hypothetical protein